MIVIAFNTTTQKFEFLPCIVSWTQKNEVKEIATDNPSKIEQLLKNSTSTPIENYTVKAYEPSEVQKTRLEEINNIESDSIFKEGFIEQVNDFINTGYIDNTYPKFMVDALLEKYRAHSKEILLKNYAADLAAIRYTKEVGGVEFMGKKVKTDRESQSTITSTVVLFNTGSMQTIDFKCDNGEWLHNLTKEQFMALAMTVSGYVNSCFRAETLANEIISALPLEQLVPDNGQRGISDIYTFEIDEIKDNETLSNRIATLKDNGYSTHNDIEKTQWTFPVIVEAVIDTKTFAIFKKDEYLDPRTGDNTTGLNIEDIFKQAFMNVIQQLSEQTEQHTTENNKETPGVATAQHLPTQIHEEQPKTQNGLTPPPESQTHNLLCRLGVNQKKYIPRLYPDKSVKITGIDKTGIAILQGYGLHEIMGAKVGTTTIKFSDNKNKQTETLTVEVLADEQPIESWESDSLIPFLN